MDAPTPTFLNPQQLTAATHPNSSPLLIIAGAGTGKTNTLAHRVAHLLSTGLKPSRLLLLTFTRRAAHEMTRRVESILSHSALSTQNSALSSQIWSGTFHSIANRLLRIHSRSIGLPESFTVVDRSDAEDLLNVVRSDLDLDRSNTRFPRKSTCLSIYSRCVNAQEPVESALKAHFPWCSQFPDQLKTLFKTYTQRKQDQNTLDYDDLLLYWHHLMQEESIAAEIRSRFDAVLVDEYQDTNALQAAILKSLRPDGAGLTVVGDDAQSIYSFRAATVHNILNFPKTFPGAAVLKLEQNYRSVQPILDATNAVISLCPRRYNKDLFSTRQSRQKPRLVTLLDEDQQSDHVIRRILSHLEAGIPLRKQAVLFRAAHHSDALEVELVRRNIPFVKYGGLKFLEAAHVKDALSLLRLAENPRDFPAAFRCLQLLDGIGPTHAKRALSHLATHNYDLQSWTTYTPPPAASAQWPAFLNLLSALSTQCSALPDQLSEIRAFYTPILEKRYDQAHVRARDLDQLQQISHNFPTRSALLTDLTLDPPNATQDLAGPPLMDEDYLILSTIHSAKGCEWDAVFVLHAADGNIPSDMATASDDEIEEERRLFYVALTRARDFLEICFPLRYYHKKRSDRHTYAQLTRFLPQNIRPLFGRLTLSPAPPSDAPTPTLTIAPQIRQKIAALWT